MEKGLRSRIHRKGRRNKHAERAPEARQQDLVRRPSGPRTSIVFGAQSYTTWAGRWYVCRACGLKERIDR